MPNDTAAAFASASRAFVVAAAGCGKTELIADSVASGTERRQLILTHTHAGVRALRDRLQRKSVSAKRYNVDTIAGFALRYTSSFPATSGCSINIPTRDEDYSDIYNGVARLLENRHAREVVTQSYAGLYVDEYQDCTLTQHAIVLRMADILPTRIVGDPLQGVFGFRNDPAIRWANDVEQHFTQLTELTTPYRWQYSNPDLGTWLGQVRNDLLQGRQFSLQSSAVRWQQLPTDSRAAVQLQLRVSHRCATNPGESVVVLRKWPDSAHRLAKQLQGHFNSMEEIECRDLMDFCRSLTTSGGISRANRVLKFASDCITSKPAWLSSLMHTVEQGRPPSDRQRSIPAAVREAVRRVAEDDSSAAIEKLLQLIRDQPDIYLYRRELYREAMRTMRNHLTCSESPLSDCAWHTRDKTRVLGRHLPRRLVSRTLLVKGLEFDHVVIVNADDFADAKNLYVALTRGAKSLTVLSGTPTIQRPVPMM